MKIACFRNAFHKGLLATFATTAVAFLPAREYKHEVYLQGLDHPLGLVALSRSAFFVSEVPRMPGKPNFVKFIHSADWKNNGAGAIMETVAEGNIYPVNFASDGGFNVYWTCLLSNQIFRHIHSRRPVDPRNSGPESSHDPSTLFFPKNPALTGPLLQPYGVAVAPTGEVYFTEMPMPGVIDANWVSVTDGENVTTISPYELAPCDIAAAADGTVYWTSTDGGAIIKRSPAGVISTFYDALESPCSIAITTREHISFQRIYVTEVPTPGVPGNRGGRNRITEIDLGTMKKTVVAEGIAMPGDVSALYDSVVFWTCVETGAIYRAWQASP